MSFSQKEVKETLAGITGKHNTSPMPNTADAETLTICKNAHFVQRLRNVKSTVQEVLNCVNVRTELYKVLNKSNNN